MIVVVVTPETPRGDEAILLTEFLRSGATFVHLRHPDVAEQVMESVLTQIPSDLLGRVAINSHHHLSERYQVGGLHFPERERRGDIESKLLNARKSGARVSTSFHSLEELHHDTEVYDYVFFGPVFQSISKPGYVPSISTETMKRSIEGHSLCTRIIGLGGVNAQNASTLRALGFQGAGLLGAVWESSDPLAEFKRIYRTLMTHANVCTNEATL